MKYITRTVWILSAVSLLTDAASEMLHPVMPLYLKSIGFSVILIGVLEGIAEATAGLSKGYFGKLSDYHGKRVPFVQLGYALSALSKPMLAMFATPLWIFFARTTDRFGKGIRTGARDAILSDEATPATKGKVFGLHRAMDTLGAVVGPLIALIYLHYHPENYKTLFLIAFVPGVLSILATLLLREKTQAPKTTATTAPKLFSFLGYWKQSPAAYRKLLIGLLAFALINSSDVFLLLKAKQSGMTDTQLIGVYIYYNLIYALAAFPMGALADKLGLRKIFILGLALFVVVYAGFGWSTQPMHFYILFFVYALFAAATEGISKAWISAISDKKDTATAIGTYAGLQSICTMLASSVAGMLWYAYDSQVVFVVAAVGAALVLIYFIVATKPLAKPEHTS